MFASILPFDVLIVLNLFSIDYNNDVIFTTSPTGLRVIYYNVVSLPVQSIFTIIKPFFKQIQCCCFLNNSQTDICNKRL